MKLAMYRGPAEDPLHKFGHAVVTLFTASEYSHCELVIDGVSWSASSRDGGVRGKSINLDSGRWDQFAVEGDEAKALEWFKEHRGARYDWAGVLRFGIPLLPRRRDQWFCSEACAAALGLSRPYTFTPQDLLDQVRAKQLGQP